MAKQTKLQKVAQLMEQNPNISVDELAKKLRCTKANIYQLRSKLKKQDEKVCEAEIVTPEPAQVDEQKLNLIDLRIRYNQAIKRIDELEAQIVDMEISQDLNDLEQLKLKIIINYLEKRVQGLEYEQENCSTCD